jgi:hypothetical protein
MAKLDKLIDYAMMREIVDLPQNIEDAKLEHPIIRAQEMARMHMCDEFYQDYLSNFNANTLSAAYSALLPYLEKFIAWQAYAFYTLKANFAPTRSGFRVHSEANSVAASDIQMGMIIKDAKLQAEYYKTLMVDYIKGHIDSYPLYCNNCDSKIGGNSFHISAVKNKNKQPEPYGTRGGCYKC